MQERKGDELEDDDDYDDAWNRGIMVLLLDGEEAFDYWTESDSLYGARYIPAFLSNFPIRGVDSVYNRHLASTWEQTYHIAGSRRRTSLASIDLFVLLDLLGARNPTVPSYFKTTHWAYKHMSSLEQRLRSLGVFRTSKLREDGLNNFLPASNKKNFAWTEGIGDDHIPFLRRGVEVLHIIPSPFPSVWHTMDDSGENLDMDTVIDWATLTTAFAAEWFELEGFLDTKVKKRSLRSEL